MTSDPSGRFATMSVKVPPRSIQNCQPDDVVHYLIASVSYCVRTLFYTISYPLLLRLIYIHRTVVEIVESQRFEMKERRSHTLA